MTFPIKHGVTLQNMHARVYKELRKGKYSVAVRFMMIENGDIIDSEQSLQYSRLNGQVSVELFSSYFRNY